MLAKKSWSVLFLRSVEKRTATILGTKNMMRSGVGASSLHGKTNREKEKRKPENKKMPIKKGPKKMKQNPGDRQNNPSCAQQLRALRHRVPSGISTWISTLRLQHTVVVWA